MATSNAQEVAATLLEACWARNIEVSNLKLQKLLYYAEAWHLVLENGSLYDEPIEAWVHGPVVPGVFRKYRSFGWLPITTLATTSSKDEDLCAHVGAVLDAYAGFSATDLERLTHSERPWIEARTGLAADEPSTTPISRKVMKQFYSAVSGQ
jgi:uncharacterized phage-associated protein